MLGKELCVSDALHYVPWNLIPPMQRAISSDGADADQLHNLFALLRKEGVDLSSLGVFLEQRFWVNPAVQWNPLYAFANRRVKSKPTCFDWEKRSSRST